MTPKKDLLDIGDRKNAFKNIKERTDLLAEGFRALYSDYIHHIEVASSPDHDIFRLRNNIEYRLFSAMFHLELLLREHYAIERNLSDLFRRKPQELLGGIYPKHPALDQHEQEITAIFDSIIFHLASSYDYISAIIDFICNRKSKSITKWSQLAKSCRDDKNDYSKLAISKVIIKQNDSFVNKLYEYRSRVIHENAFINPISFSINVARGEADVKFLAKPEFLKNFSALKQKAIDHKITVAYTCDWLIHATISSIAKIALGLREEMKRISTFPKHVKGSDLILLHFDPTVGFAQPASTPMWKRFEENIFSADSLGE